MNQSTDDASIYLNLNYTLTLLFSTIALIGMIGNILVILSVCIDLRMKRSLTNRLIVHVACCDLIILLFNIPDLIQFVSSRNGNWILNEISCKLIRSILVLAQYASVLTMCMITIERFIGIVYPLRSKLLLSKKNLRQMALFIWIFAIVCTSPNFFYLRVIETDDHRTRHCFLVYSKDSIEHQRRYIIHKSIESTIFYFIPLLLQIYCYIRISIELCRVDQTLTNSYVFKKNEVDDDAEFDVDNEDNVTSRITMIDSPSNVPKHSFVDLKRNSYSTIIHFKIREEKQRKNNHNLLKSRRSVIKMLVVVVLIYFISFSPQVLVFILFQTNAIRQTPKFIETPYFIAFTMLLVTISSASNPIVYTIFCYKFRLSFAKILRRFCFCILPFLKSSSHHHSTTIQQFQLKDNYLQQQQRR